MLPSVLSGESEDFFPGSPFVHHSNARYSGTFHCCLLESFQVGEEQIFFLTRFPRPSVFLAGRGDGIVEVCPLSSFDSFLL